MMQGSTETESGVYRNSFRIYSTRSRLLIILYETGGLPRWANPDSPKHYLSVLYALPIGGAGKSWGVPKFSALVRITYKYYSEI